jgi:diadenosine tetraphosphatase ApaH/serine/threonine PP2A family protein phosphatase
MSWAIFSDVHGNLEALEAVAEDFGRRGITRAFFIGDAVGYGPSPNECLKMIAELTTVRLMGNHDHAVLQENGPEEFNKHAQAAIRWTRTALNAEARQILHSFTMSQTVGQHHLVHASPLRPQHWDYILDQLTALAALKNFSEWVCFVGHTHQPRIFQEAKDSPCSELPAADLHIKDDARYIINVGSVGQPRDGDPRACYAVYDPERQQLTYARVPYDIEKTQDKMRAVGLPEFLIDRLETGH